LISEVLLSLGSNIGHRLDNLQRAVNALGQYIAVEALAPVYETEPWGLTEQPEFLNSCVRGRTRLDPESLLVVCKEIEINMGREPGIRWGPRLIDIDILYFNAIQLKNKRVQIPHPEIADRAFVLAPLADIAPDHHDPVSGQSVSEMLANIGRNGVEQVPPGEKMLRRPVHLAWGIKTYVMAILNITRDSFSGDGILQSKSAIESAVEEVKQFARNGADIIDIGGESTRPGSKPISQGSELERVLPIIEAVRSAIDLPLSIDTYRSGVASEALKSGADWINDIWGLRMDEEMASVASEFDCPIVLMHNRSKPKDAVQEEKLGGRYIGVEYENLIEDISNELDTSISRAIESNVNAANIIIDPGIGFGKTVSQNLHLMNRLDRLTAAGYPLLVGPSRKSFIGYALNLPIDQRLEGTAAAVAIAIDRGADIIRVHDVKAMSRVARMSDAIIRE
jgi:dihydropteroate synthase/2-amino-4-hydroxy-6-hydroxymethyldihydropteridine diphosphokinase